MIELSEELIIFFTAAIPFFGLHSAIPLALAYYKMHWLKTLFLSLSGNILPILPFLFLLEFLAKYFKKNGYFNNFFTWNLEYTNEKSILNEKYEMLGLMIFVSVPLPFTGIWFGSLIAVILGMRFKLVFLAMSLGLIISGIITLCVLKLGYLKAVMISVALIGITTAGLNAIVSKRE